jgi:hypothetical protein
MNHKMLVILLLLHSILPCKEIFRRALEFLKDASLPAHSNNPYQILCFFANGKAIITQALLKVNVRAKANLPKHAFETDPANQGRKLNCSWLRV